MRVNVKLPIKIRNILLIFCVLVFFGKHRNDQFLLTKIPKMNTEQNKLMC